jgi:hypothetical protein
LGAKYAEGAKYLTNADSVVEYRFPENNVKQVWIYSQLSEDREGAHGVGGGYERAEREALRK